MREKAPEETGMGPRAKRGGEKARHEGGFKEGEFGRGPTPFHPHMSHNRGRGMGTAAHEGTSGRGGEGRIGENDDHKLRSEDLSHPQSHAEFERLGTAEE